MIFCSIHRLSKNYTPSFDAVSLSERAWGVEKFIQEYGFAPRDIEYAGIIAHNTYITGNLGLSVSAPINKLDINGAAAIGTSYAGLQTVPSNGLAVQGNVGIGTFNPFGGGLIVLPVNTGNVGIGSITPGKALDVSGTVRATGLAMSGQTPVSGYVLTATDSGGDTTWSTAGSVAAASGWTQSGTNVYTAGSNNVGIGTSDTSNGKLAQVRHLGTK